MENKRQTKKDGTDMPECMDGTKNADRSSRIAEKERLVVQARQFNLLSNVFMSVALDDKAACQHILRILT